MNFKGLISCSEFFLLLKIFRFQQESQNYFESPCLEVWHFKYLPSRSLKRLLAYNDCPIHSGVIPLEATLKWFPQSGKISFHTNWCVYYKGLTAGGFFENFFNFFASYFRVISNYWRKKITIWSVVTHYASFSSQSFCVCYRTVKTKRPPNIFLGVWGMFNILRHKHQ